ncbi:MAG: hypothetical protein JXR77_09190 [Lentisphaeria bacterium]|nr:hypothetical protein [Lentisphaeria bacterium]
MVGAALGIAVLLAVQAAWFSWRLEKAEGAWRAETTFLKQEIVRLQRAGGRLDAEATDPERREEHLREALRRLESRNLVDRYQAALVVREYGARAIPELIERIRGDSSRAREAALLLLAKIDGAQQGLPELRAMADAGLNGTADATGFRPDPKTLAAILGLLAQQEDRDSLGLFRGAIDSPEEVVRGAALLGLRQLKAIEAVPELLERLGQEREVANRQLRRTILALCRENPDAFVDRIGALAPKQRFEVVRLLGDDDSAAAVRTLRRMTADGDPRVALGAAHVLAKRGDRTGEPAAKAIAQRNDLDAELQRVASEVERLLK